MGETAATEGGMRRGQVSPAAKYLENLGLEMPEEKNSPTLQLILCFLLKKILAAILSLNLKSSICNLQSPIWILQNRIESYLLGHGYLRPGVSYRHSFFDI